KGHATTPVVDVAAAEANRPLLGAADRPVTHGAPRSPHAHLAQRCGCLQARSAPPWRAATRQPGAPPGRNADERDPPRLAPLNARAIGVSSKPRGRSRPRRPVRCAAAPSTPPVLGHWPLPEPAAAGTIVTMSEQPD